MESISAAYKGANEWINVGPVSLAGRNHLVGLRRVISAACSGIRFLPRV